MCYNVRHLPIQAIITLHTGLNISILHIMIHLHIAFAPFLLITFTYFSNSDLYPNNICRQLVYIPIVCTYINIYMAMYVLHTILYFISVSLFYYTVTPKQIPPGLHLSAVSRNFSKSYKKN